MAKQLGLPLRGTLQYKKIDFVREFWGVFFMKECYKYIDGLEQNIVYTSTFYTMYTMFLLQAIVMQESKL